MRDNLLEQYRRRGIDVSVHDGFTLPDVPELPLEAVILSGGDDAAALRFLQRLAEVVPAAPERPLVHLILSRQATLLMLRRTDFPPSVNEVFETWPTVMEEVWAERLVVRYPGISDNELPPLDREPIGPQSDRFVHLVIAGTDGYAGSVAVKAAQIAHFPNYDGKDKTPLRTRITFISPDIVPFRDAFISRLRTLMDNSFYRTVFPSGQRSELHHPQFEGRREDFVDVEWEFVDAPLSDATVSGRLSLWAEDPRRYLTIVLSSEDDTQNVESAMTLPAPVYDRHIPVWVRQHCDVLSSSVSASCRYGSIIPFGMDDCGYDLRLPAQKMSRLLHYYYYSVRRGLGVPTVFPRAVVEAQWRKAGDLKNRQSNVLGVMTMATKMHSLGHSTADLSTYYALSREEATALARTEHNRWSVERLLSGTRPCTDSERREIAENIGLKSIYKRERDAHFDLCSYDERGTDERGNDVRIYDIALTECIPLIVESYLKEAEG